MASDAKAAEIPAVPAGAGADRIDPLAMTIAQAAKVLSAVGVGSVTEEIIRRHVAAGAPATTDGRISLVSYAAWLNQHMGPDGQDKDHEGADDHGA